jgi:hypothetical protein
MKYIHTVKEAEAAPEGTSVDDGWGDQWTRRGDGWVREVWCSHDELIKERDPVTITEDEGA